MAVDVSRYNLVPNTDNITNQLMGLFKEKRDNERLDQQAAQKTALEKIQVQLQDNANQALLIRDLPDDYSKRTAIIKMGQQAIDNGGDHAMWMDMLNAESPDELNRKIMGLALKGTDGSKFIASKLGAGSANQKGVQFGAQQTFKDEAGNLYFGTSVNNPNTAETKASLSPIGKAPETPVGKVSLVSGLGLNAGETVKHKAAIKGAEKGQELKQELKHKPLIEEAVIQQRILSKKKGELFTDLVQMKAAMPGLEKAVGNLRELAGIATSTIGGKVFDFAVKETGFGSTKGATAAAKFTAIITNQVLPLLKLTFGGSFSVQEGEKLEASMGDVNASPDEKMAQLDAFMDQKIRNIESTETELDTVSNELAAPANQTIDLKTLSIDELLKLREQVK